MKRDDLYAIALAIVIVLCIAASVWTFYFAPCNQLKGMPVYAPARCIV